MEPFSKIDIDLKVVKISGAFTYHSGGSSRADNFFKLKPHGRDYLMAQELPYLSKAGYNVRIVGDIRPIAESLDVAGIEYRKKNNNTTLEII